MLPTFAHLGTVHRNHTAMVEFFVAKDHLRDGVLFLLDVLATDKGLSMQRAWHCACTLTEDVPSYLVQN